MESKLEKEFLEELELNKISLLRLCAIYSSDADMKRDYFQEAILNMWKSLPNYKGKASLKTWMYRITLNVCLGLKTKARKVKLESIEFENPLKPENEDKEDHRLVWLKKCIAGLNAVDKSIITLYLDELKYKEIASITGLTENHIAVKIKRIKNKLLNCIKQHSNG